MKKLKYLASAAIIAGSIFLFTNQSYAGGRVVLAINVPAIETVVPCPGPGYVWVKGHSKFDKLGFRVWVPGHWKRI